MAQWEGLGAGRRGDVRREGGGGAVTWEGARQRSDASDVCGVLRVERSSRRSPSRLALSSSGGGAVGGGEVPHAEHTEPQLRRGAGSRGGWEVLGEVHCGGGCAEL